MLNKAMIIGRLGQDPEVKYSQAGKAICSITVATDESYTDRDGNRVDRTEWHRVATYDRIAENIGKFLRKGSLVYVEGKLATRKWQASDGSERSTTEIRAERVQFLERKNSGDERLQQAQQRQPAQRQQFEDNAPMGSEIDEAPF